MPDPVAVNSMFARIARRYDLANLVLCGGIDTRWRKKLVLAVCKNEGREILDLATGSGDVAFALSDYLAADSTITGMDFCQPMLDEAEKKKRQAGPAKYRNITWRQGDIQALPFADERFDAITIAFGVRNLAERARGLREMRRVLRPKGRLYILEFSQPAAWFRPLYFFYLRHILPRLAGLITGDREAYDYLNNTIGQFPDREALSREIREAGFTKVNARPMTFGVVALHEAEK